MRKLQGHGKASEEKQTTNLTNLKGTLFRTIKQATATTHMKVITWEKFEKGVGAFPAQQVLKRHTPILNQDLVVVPLNIDNSHYWFLLPVQPPL